MMSPKHFSFSGLAAAVLAALSVQNAFSAEVHDLLAQNATDAGSVRNRIESPTFVPALPEKKEGQLMPALPALQEIEGLKVKVTRFRVNGNSRYSEALLLKPLEASLGQEMGFADLQNAAAQVAEVYRTEGWVVRSYLPEQDVTTGEVLIQVIESNFGQVQAEGATSRLNWEQILAFVTANQAQGEALNVNKIDRALLLLSDIPGVSANGNLIRGEAEGRTDLLLSLADTPGVTGAISADNSGSVATGKNSATAAVYANSLLGKGEQLQLSTLQSRGTQYGRVGFTAPVGYKGLRVGVNTSDLRYELTDPRFKALDAHGSSSSQGLELIYPLIRSRAENLYLNYTADRREFLNQSLGQTVSDYSVSSQTLQLSGNRFDTDSGDSTTASIGVTVGHVNLAGSPSAAQDASTTQTDGQFSKIRYAVSHTIELAPSWSVMGSWMGQWAEKNLDSSERFFLGGINNVRAYPSGEGSGSEGQLLSAEVRWNTGAGFLLKAFYDHGRTHVNKNNDFQGAATLNSYALRGVGVSADWIAREDINARITFARRLSDNPARDTNGKDSDGTLDKNRVWLQLSFSF